MGPTVTRNSCAVLCNVGVTTSKADVYPRILQSHLPVDGINKIHLVLMNMSGYYKLYVIRLQIFFSNVGLEWLFTKNQGCF